MLRGVFCLTLCLLTISANPRNSLKPVHPDEPVEYTYNTRFSTQNSLGCLGSIGKALASFRKLTETAKEKISENRMQEIGNTAWEVQNLGFCNWTGAIEGTLYKNDFIIKKLRYELLIEKAKSAAIKQSDIKKAEKEYKQAQQDFHKFWDTFGIAD